MQVHLILKLVVTQDQLTWVNENELGGSAYLVRYADDAVFAFRKLVEAQGFRGKSVNRRTGKSFWRVKRRTCSKRFRKKLKEITAFIRQHRHEKTLVDRIVRSVRGHLNYFAINDNYRRCGQFILEVARSLFRWLNRRSQKRSMDWVKFQQVLEKSGYTQRAHLKNLFFRSSAARP